MSSPNPGGSVVSKRYTAAAKLVDELIEERAPTLSANKTIWGLLRKGLDPLLKYHEAVRLADKVSRQTGRETLDMCSDRLGLQVHVKHADRIPADGRLIIVCNHPTGLADGVAMHDALRRAREDVMIYANSDAFRVSKDFDDILIPIELNPDVRKHTKTKQALIETNRTLKGEKCLVIFPSGRLSFLTLKGIRERDWKSSFVRLSQKFNTPILPMRMTARNSALFYAFSMLHRELRDISLFYELLNKSGKEFDLTVGKLIMPETLEGVDDASYSRALQKFVEFGDISGAQFEYVESGE